MPKVDNNIIALITTDYVILIIQKSLYPILERAALSQIKTIFTVIITNNQTLKAA
jgi:hypothetical protein